MKSPTQRSKSLRNHIRPLSFEPLEARLVLAGAYELDIVAATGSGQFSGLGSLPSINNHGDVAFVGHLPDGGQAIFVNDGDSTLNATPMFVSPDRTFPGGIQISDNGQIGAVDRTSSGIVSSRARIWRGTAAPDANLIIARGTTPNPLPGHFDILLSHVSLQDPLVGLPDLMFAGLDGSLWDVHSSGAEVSDTNNSTALAFYPSGASFMFKAASGPERLVAARSGANQSITVYDYYTAVDTIASNIPGVWTALGLGAGISDDGKMVVFAGSHPTLGTGIFASVRDGSGYTAPQKIAGVSGDGLLDPNERWTDSNGNNQVDPAEDAGLFGGFGPSLSSNARIGVNRHVYGHAGAIDQYSVAFMATDMLGTIGLYTLEVYVKPSGDISAFQPLSVISVGATVEGLSGSAQMIEAYDPINTMGDVVFAVTTSTGAKAIIRGAIADSDGDGLYDVWESDGIDINGDGILELNLPALGADALRKDVFVEIDAMQGLDPLQSQYVPSGVPTRLLTGTVLDGVVEAFYKSPVSNPTSNSQTGGPPGINLHIKIDETNLNSELWHYDSQKKWPAEFDATKAQHFGASQDDAHVEFAKHLVYRYAIFAHSFELPNTGIAELGDKQIPGRTFGGNDFVIALGPLKENEEVPEEFFRKAQAGTFMHELGHTLGLQHGGNDEVQYKLNYRSVMNYIWQLPYVPNWRLDYSSDGLPALDENSLIESNGLGGDPNVLVPINFHQALNEDQRAIYRPMGGPADLNGDGIISTSSIAHDLNVDGELNAYTDHDDWSALIYRFWTSTDSADGIHASAEINELTYQMVLRGIQSFTDPGDAVDGDYNKSGIVDAADYVVWRKTLGTNVPPSSGADGDGDGIVDQDDYVIWRANFGADNTTNNAAFSREVTAGHSSSALDLAFETSFSDDVELPRHRSFAVHHEQTSSPTGPHGRRLTVSKQFVVEHTAHDSALIALLERSANDRGNDNVSKNRSRPEQTQVPMEKEEREGNLRFRWTLTADA